MDYIITKPGMCCVGSQRVMVSGVLIHRCTHTEVYPYRGVLIQRCTEQRCTNTWRINSVISCAGGIGLPRDSVRPGCSNDDTPSDVKRSLGESLNTQP